MMRSLLLISVSCSLGLLSCGGSSFSVAEDGSGGHGARTGTGGHGAGGSASGGTVGGGGDAAGGNGAGGSGAGGSGAGGSGTGGAIGAVCQNDADCVAVANHHDPCYSEGCSLPTPASKDDVAADACLVRWEERESVNPSGCASEEPVECDLSCALPPDCIRPYCDDGTCQLSMGYGSECEPPDPPTSCEELYADRMDALAAAQACDTDATVVQCTGKSTVPGTCGCPVIVNDAHPSLVEAARSAYETWAEQCADQAPACLVPCVENPDGGYCAEGGTCQFGEDGLTQ